MRWSAVVVWVVTNGGIAPGNERAEVRDGAPGPRCTGRPTPSHRAPDVSGAEV